MYKILYNLILIILFLILIRTSKTTAVAPHKISKEIIILSFIIILYAVQGMPTLDFNAYYVRFYPAGKMLIFGRYLTSLGLRIIMLIAGIGIIFRKEIFRRVIIGSACFNLATIFWKHPPAAVKRFILLKINEGVLSFELLPRINQLTWMYVAVYALLDIMVALFLIYLFTRLRIREQFR